MAESDDGWRASAGTHVKQVAAVGRRAMRSFPVRVWQRFMEQNGLLLAASLAYQQMFAVFAVLYTAFAVIGVWLGGSVAAVQRMIGIVNHTLPGIIADHNGLVTPDDVTAIAQRSGNLLAVTGAAAFLLAGWTAIAFVTFARRAIRDIFGLPVDHRSYLLLKSRDLVAAVLFGVAQVVGAALGVIGTGALRGILAVFGVADVSSWATALSVILSVASSFVINATAVAVLFRFLTGTRLPWSVIRPGSLLGGAALSVLQLGAGVLVRFTGTNPLLATFTVFGFMLWFHLAGIVLLSSASWIALAAEDRDLPLTPEDDAARRLALRRAQLAAAQERLRGAEQDLASAGWRRWRVARKAVREAVAELRSRSAALAEAERAVRSPAHRVGTTLPAGSVRRPR